MWMVWSSFVLPLVVKAFQEYTEPEDANPSSPQRRAPTAGEDETVVLPLGENTLTHNLGIPVLIVCTKVSQVRSAPLSLPYTLVGPFWTFSTFFPTEPWFACDKTGTENIL